MSFLVGVVLASAVVTAIAASGGSPRTAKALTIAAIGPRGHPVGRAGALRAAVRRRSSAAFGLKRC
jgi:hypothetical protein